MITIDPIVRDALDEISPPRHARTWEEVIGTEPVAAARQRLRWRQRRLLTAVATPVVVAAIMLAAVLAWPFGGTRQLSFLDRAAAAIGDGPVLHVRVESGFGATAIDLKSGSRSFVHGEEELWYDPARGIHDVSTFRGVVQGDETYPTGRVEHLDSTLSFLAIGYRNALKNGSARVLGDSTIDGVPVTWIRVDSQMLPDASDGKQHEWAHDVAVSKDTFKPVATRETRDGTLSPDGISKIASIETLPSGSGDFAASPPSVSGPVSVTEAPVALSPAEASAVLGRPLLTPGETVAGLKLSNIAKEVRREGLDRATGRWKTTTESVTLSYGAMPGSVGGPPPSGDYLQIGEMKALDPYFARGVRNYFPPEGELLTFGGRLGLMQHRGVYVVLEASSEDLLIEAAHGMVSG